MSNSSEYLVMARSMRPQTFNEVVGQENIKTTLRNAHQLKRLGHAYLFCGPHGTGKTTLTRIFAKILNCDHPLDGEPCNQCSSCKEISATNSLDVIEIDGASNRGIDDIRQINESVNFASRPGKYKIFIIDEVHMLTKEAFNALLKTLEAPPQSIKFFFATTEPQKVPSTILSRCQCFQLQPHSHQSITNHLKQCAKSQNIDLDEESANLIAKRSQGSLRDALVLMDQVISFCNKEISFKKVSDFLGLIAKDELFKFDEKAAQDDIETAIDLTQKIVKSGKNLNHFLEMLIEHYRQILYIKIFHQNPKCLPVTHQEWPSYQKSASYYSYEQSLYILDLILEVQNKIKVAISKEIAIENLLIQIIRSKHRVSVESIMNKLDTMKQSSNLISASSAQKPQEKFSPPLVSAPANRQEQKKDFTKHSSEPEKIDDKNLKSRYDTVMQFAAVELEGSLKQES